MTATESAPPPEQPDPLPDLTDTWPAAARSDTSLDLTETWPAAERAGTSPDSADPLPAPDEIVALIDVHRSFPGPPEVQAVRGVNLTIRQGDYVSIVGPSGSGKSTLLHVLGLLDRPTSGTYLLDGADVATMSEGARAGMRGGRIGFVFQAFHLLASRSVIDNVMLPMVYQAVGRKERRHRAAEALDRVGMGHRVDFAPSTLSGGERQRVAVARALVGRPSLLLADEPTGNLDQENAAGVLDLFESLHSGGITIAVITHDERVSARAQRRVRMTDGRLYPA